jgi:peptidoglycan hydrolase-like protein with peptidoglycan-binding domain
LVLLGATFLGWLYWKIWRETPPSQLASRPTNDVQTVVAPEPVRLARTNPALPSIRATNAISLLRTSMPIVVPTNITPPPPPKAFSARVPRNVYEAQLALARRGISSGSLDGVLGFQTRLAIRAFQEKAHLPVTGELDLATKERLLLASHPEKTYVVTTNDLDRLQPLGAGWLAKSLQKRLDYENILELAAEAGRAHPNLIRALNPTIQWTNVTAGTLILLPDAPLPPIRSKAAVVRIRLMDKTLQAFDGDQGLLAHFPCSIARRIEKRPVGQLFVEEVALNPTYRFDPDNFPESAEARRIGRPLTIAAGPNNPVGTAWIGLNLPGYGIHGTPKPEEVGRTESHGCFRLANWNAQYLAQLVRGGTPVIVEP